MEINKQRFVSNIALLFFPIVLAACAQSPDPSKIGVFAKTNNGIQELTAYGEQIDSRTYRMPQNLPAAKNVTAFFLNMPGTEVANSKAFWVPGPQQSLDESSTTIVPLTTETVKGSMYKLASADLEKKSDGIILFKVGMPLGTADRIYGVSLSK